MVSVLTNIIQLFTIVEQMHDFHKKSPVITAVYCNAVQTLGVTG